jgi:hypothetical protein
MLNGILVTLRALAPDLALVGAAFCLNGVRRYLADLNHEIKTVTAQRAQLEAAVTALRAELANPRPHPGGLPPGESTYPNRWGMSRPEPEPGEVSAGADEQL